MRDKKCWKRMLIAAMGAALLIPVRVYGMGGGKTGSRDC